MIQLEENHAQTQIQTLLDFNTASRSVLESFARFLKQYPEATKAHKKAWNTNIRKIKKDIKTREKKIIELKRHTLISDMHGVYCSQCGLVISKR